MKRRTFLGNMFKGVGAMMIGGTIVGSLKPEPKYPFVAADNVSFNDNLITDVEDIHEPLRLIDPDTLEGEVYINTTTRTIGLKGEPKYSMGDLYKYLRDEWEPKEGLYRNS